MSESILSYRKSVKLPVAAFEAAQPMRRALDEQVAQAVVSLGTYEPELAAKRTTDESGNCQLHATAKGYELVVATRAGQDSVFRGGERSTFVSYTISATAALKSLNRAAAVSRELTYILRGVGAVVFAGLFFLAVDLLMRRWDIPEMKVPAMLIVGVVLAGSWLGERLGNWAGEKMEAGAWAKAEKNQALPQLELLWGHLEKRFNALLQPHEGV